MKKQSLKQLVIGAFVVILIAYALALSLHYIKNKKQNLKNIPVVSAIQLKKEMLPYFISLPGTLLPFETVDVYAKASGFISVMNVDRGYFVKQGDILAQLVDPQLDRDIERAKAAFESASEQYKRAKPVAGQSVSREQFAALKGASDVALKAWQALLAQKQFLTVSAPFDGIITTRYLHPGALVDAGSTPGSTPIVKIDDLKRLRLVINIPQADIGSVAEGNQIPFLISSYPTKTFYGKVARISHALNLKTLTEPVELDVDNSNLMLLPGMVVNISWPATRRNPTFVVPKKAIVTTTYAMFVIRLRNNVTEWINVTRGHFNKDKVEIFGDLQEGDLIALNETDELRANTKVQIEGGKSLG